MNRNFTILGIVQNLNFLIELLGFLPPKYHLGKSGQYLLEISLILKIAF